MNKKDRIALVVSVLVLGIALLIMLQGNGGLELGTFILFILFTYWGYRFIKNDISFLQIKEK